MAITAKFEGVGRAAGLSGSIKALTMPQKVRVGERVARSTRGRGAVVGLLAGWTAK